MAKLPTSTILYNPFDTLKLDNRFNRRLRSLIKQNSIINENSFLISVDDTAKTVTIGKGFCVVNDVVIQMEEVTVDLVDESVITGGMDDQYIYILIDYGYTRRMEVNKANILVLKQEDVDFAKMDRYVFLGAIACVSGTISYIENDTFFSDHADYIPITTLEQLALIGNDVDYPLDGNYMLLNDIDASATRQWNYYEGEYTYINDYLGWEPIGMPVGFEEPYVEDYGDPFTTPQWWERAFTGIFDGLGHTIYNLYSTYSNTGLFFACSAATVRNLKMENCDLTTRGDAFYVGSVCGIARYSYFQNIHSTGYVRARFGGGIAGLFAFNKDEVDTTEYAFSNCRNDCYITCYDPAGGIVGSVEDELGDYETVGTYYLMENCISTGTITSSSDLTGGLIGQILTDGSTYSFHEDSILMVNSSYHKLDYETTLVEEDGDPDPEYYKSDTQLKQQATFVDWDFEDIWEIEEGTDYPYLSWNNITSTSKVYSDAYYELGNINGGVVLINDNWQEDWQ